MICIGGIVFFHCTRDTRRWNPLVHVVIPVVGAVVFAAALYGSVHGPHPARHPEVDPVPGIGRLLWLRSRRPDAVSRIGSILGEEGGADAAMLDEEQPPPAPAR